MKTLIVALSLMSISCGKNDPTHDATLDPDPSSPITGTYQSGPHPATGLRKTITITASTYALDYSGTSADPADVTYTLVDKVGSYHLIKITHIDSSESFMIVQRINSGVYLSNCGSRDNSEADERGLINTPMSEGYGPFCTYKQIQ